MAPSYSAAHSLITSIDDDADVATDRPTGFDPHLPPPHIPPDRRAPTHLHALHPRATLPHFPTRPRVRLHDRLHRHPARPRLRGAQIQNRNRAAVDDPDVEGKVSGNGVCGEEVGEGREGVDEWGRDEWVGYDGGVYERGVWWGERVGGDGVGDGRCGGSGAGV